MQRVGWVERLVRRSSMSEGGSDTHQLHFTDMMGFARAQPILRPYCDLRVDKSLLAMTLANIVARMERSEIRDSRDAGPGLRGACHRAALRADPLAPSGLQPSDLPVGRQGCRVFYFGFSEKYLLPSDPNQI